MNTGDTEIVTALRAAIVRRVGNSRYDVWLGEPTRLHLCEGRLRVLAPSPFVQDWLRTNLRSDMEACCAEVLGHRVPIDFSVLEPKSVPLNNGDSRPASASPPSPPSTSVTMQTPGAESSRQTSTPAAKQSTPGRKYRSLDRLVTGACNRVAASAAGTVAEQPGNINPLFVHGPAGVGKTHLLEGIWSGVKGAGRRVHAVYLSGEQFTSLFIEAISGGGMPNFRRKYRKVDVLLLDDIQIICGKRRTTEELLFTIDTLLREGRQVVLSADRSPADLPGLGAELASRLTGGLVCRVDLPDYQTRLGIVGRLADSMQLSMPAEVQQFVAANLASDARQLTGALHSLHATSIALGAPIEMPLAEAALGDLIRQSQRPVRLTDIEQAVCQVFGLEARSLKSTSKAKGVNGPRMLAMWLARKHTRAALSEISRYFGRRSHSSVVTAQKRVNGLLSGGKPLETGERAWNVEDAIRRVEAELQAG